MEDKELFDFFRNRSASFDEMPSDNVWNKIQTNMEASKETSFFPTSKIIKWSVLTLAAVVTILLFIPKEAQTTIKNTNNKQTQNETIVEANSSENDSIIKTNTPLMDTLKRKKVFKKNLVTTLKDTVSVIKKLQPVLKIDSLEAADSRVALDSLTIKPQVKGNRLLFETKQFLTTTEFDSFVQKVLAATKTNYGALIVIKAKGNKPFRQVVKFPEKNTIPKTTIQPAHYTSKIVIVDSLLKNDSIYFQFQDIYFTH